MDVVPISQSFHDQLIIAHAVFAAIAVLFTMPAAILIARYLRRSRWFPYHAGLQLVTLACLVIVFATGTRAVMSSGHGSEFAGKGADFHHKLGLAMFILVFAQALLGAFGHRLKPGHWVRHVHHVSGIVIAAFLYTQFHGGFDEWNENSESMTQVPKSVVIIFWIIFGLEVGAYLLGWIIAPKPTLRPALSDDKLPMTRSV